MPTIMLVVTYDGAPFSGFARQMTSEGEERAYTVQGEIEHALELLYRRRVETTCAGRTDAGVHALGQVVSFILTPDEMVVRGLERLVYALNGILPDEISIRSAKIASEDFSPRFDAKSREYRYRIVCGHTPPVFLRDFCWWVRGSLDVNAMREAAAMLVGTHDFASFCLATSARDRNTVRTLATIEMDYETELGEECLCIRIVGSGFLHNMVRIIVGTLVEVGSGRKDPSWVAEVLAAADRRSAGPTAPAQGLVLWRVEY